MLQLCFLTLILERMNPEGLAVGKHPNFVGFAELANSVVQ